MSHDEHARRLDDIEKRLARLEKRSERPPISFEGKDGRTWALNVKTRISGWCECGRDVCRAPNCFSHKPDPLGR